MIEIIPAILTNNAAEFDSLMARAEGVSKRIHIDIIDGVFVDNHTVLPSHMIDYETELLVDYHLMVDEPISWVDRCVSGQADRIIGHIEKMHDQVAFVGKVQSIGTSVGLAIDLHTPVGRLDSTILTNLDVVLVMSIKAGFGGQEFRDETIKKIKRLSELRQRNGFKYKICVDGGINPENIRRVHLSGADEVSVGRRLYEGSIADNINKYRQVAYGS